MSINMIRHAVPPVSARGPYSTTTIANGGPYPTTTTANGYPGQSTSMLSRTLPAQPHTSRLSTQQQNVGTSNVSHRHLPSTPQYTAARLTSDGRLQAVGPREPARQVTLNGSRYGTVTRMLSEGHP